MPNKSVLLREGVELPSDAVIHLYQKCGWSAARKPDQLLIALSRSEVVVSAWHRELLVGLGNAISDGALVVYYPHLVVLPVYQRQGIGRRIMEALQHRYAGFHQQVLLTVKGAAPFYEKLGFQHAHSVEPMWIYDNSDH